MRILVLVTRNAGFLELFSIDIAGVASITFDFLVRAAKRIFGFVVVKPHVLPFGLIVARLAFRPVPVGMDVLQAMAGHASTREILVDFADMTGRAIDVFVGAFEREFCLAVVIGLYPRPL